MSAPQFDPATYETQLAEKAARLRDLLAPFDAPAPEVFDSPDAHYRLRTEFRLWYDQGQRHYAMFEPGDNHTPILIDDFPIASRHINELMPQLKAGWQASDALGFKLFQVEFLTTMAGDALITLAYHRPLNEAWQAAAEQLAANLGVSIVGRSRGKRIVIGRDYVEEELVVAGRTFRYRQPEGAFTQPNGEVCQKMLNWAFEALGERDDDLLELYCGNGNFTLPLASRVRRVLATEISKSSVNAALANLADNGIDNVTLVRLSAEELTQALNEVRPFRRLAGIDLKSYDFGSVFVGMPAYEIDLWGKIRRANEAARARRLAMAAVPARGRPRSDGRRRTDPGACSHCRHGLAGKWRKPGRRAGATCPACTRDRRRRRSGGVGGLRMAVRQRTSCAVGPG